MQPVVQPAVQPGKCLYTRYSRLYNRLYNRLYRVYRHFPGCTTGCIVYTQLNRVVSVILFNYDDDDNDDRRPRNATMISLYIIAGNDGVRH